MDNQQPSNNKFYQRPQKGNGFIYRYISPSGYSYVGQTINSLAERAKGISGRGYKKCSIFWKAIQKYQFPNFSFEILEETRIEELNKREKYFIEKFNSIVPNGYNLSDGGEGGKKVGVYVYNAQNGELLEHYGSVTEASITTGVPVETISSIINDSSDRKIAHNLHFSKELKNSLDIGRENWIPVHVYDSDGEYLKTFSSMKAASDELKISTSSIYRHLHREISICGYYFRKEKTDKIEPKQKSPKEGFMVRQIEPITMKTVHIYPSLSSAAKSVGLASSASISRAIKRNGKAKGFYWHIIEGSTTKRSGNPSEPVRDI